MSIVIGVDVGTSGTKALAVDESGKVVASALVEYPLAQPEAELGRAGPRPTGNGRRSMRCRDWRDRWASRRATSRASGLTGQMHGSVFLDADNQVLRPAILWCDQRTAEQCDEITEKVGAEQADRDGVQPGADRLHRAEDPLAARERAGGLREGPRRSCCPRTTSASS